MPVNSGLALMPVLTPWTLNEQSSPSPQDQLLPPVSVPKKATAGRPPLPAVAGTKAAFLFGLPLITVASTSILGSQVKPPPGDTAPSLIVYIGKAGPKVRPPSWLCAARASETLCEA